MAMHLQRGRYHLNRKMLYPLILVCMFSLGAPVTGRHGGSPTPDGERTPVGETRGAGDTQMVGSNFAASAAPAGRVVEEETFETVMKGGVAARSGHGGTRAGDAVSGQTEYKMSCFDDDKGLYQLDIIQSGHGRTGGQRWSNQGDKDHGQHTRRAPRHAGEVVYRSKKVQWMMADRDHRRYRRAVTSEDFLLWPNATVPYTIDEDFHNETKDLLLKSMRHWMEHTCLQFIPRVNHTDYVRFLLGQGCCSMVGHQGGPQNVSLGVGCMTFGTMIHEIGHVIGFWHEHSRPDRDDHVTVVEDNIWKAELHNFYKYEEKTINSLGQPYDYDSVMHYGPRSFSLSKDDTLIPKHEHPIGQRRGLSVGDILQARLLYRCHSKQECGGTLYDGRGFISSPSYPQAVSPNITCDWSIAAPKGSALKLEFLDMDLPSSDDGKCDDAYIEVRQGQGELSPLIGQFCGDVKPTSPILTDGGVLWMRFKSGRKRHRMASGFAARYQSVSFRRYLTATRGIIKSMNYPLSFPPDSDSMWQITVKYGFIVLLRLNELLIPHIKSTGCPGDYLKIIDGADSQSKLITKLCRSQKRVGVVSTGSSLRIELHSVKRKLYMLDEITRFLAKYLARDLNECRNNNGGCQQACLNLVGDYVCGCRHGYTISDDFHNCTDIDECSHGNGGCSHICVNTEGSFRCECRIGFQISEYNHTHCEDVNECESPHLDVCEHYCHNTYGAFACSCDPAFMIGVDGMSCELVPGCGGLTNDVEGVISRPHIPTNNTHSIDCIWFIDVPDNLRISLSLELFEWSSNNSCADYIAVCGEESYDGQYPRVCGENGWEHTYNTTSSRVWVHYHSDWPHDGAFLMDYYTSGSSDDHVIKCGGSLNDSGVIETPGFPTGYPSKLQCSWNISNVSIIAFHFEKFDIEPESSCQFDYLELIDGPEGRANSTHIGRFCGSDPPPSELKLSTGELWLIFRSDATVQGRGFRAVYEVQ